MREPISLKEILAALIRKGTFLLWMALILGVLLGGYKFLQLRAEAGKPENAPEKIEQRREAAQAEWQDKKEQLEKELEKAKKDLELQEEYCENSILMQVNPYDTAKCTIILSITGLEIPPEEGTDSAENRASRMVAKIQEQYMLYWNSADLQVELAKHGYPEIEEKYHRESVRIEISGGGTLSVISLGKDAETAEKLAQAAYACMRELHPRVEAGAYAHDLTLFHSNTKMVVSSEIESRQEKARELCKTYAGEIGKLEQKLKALGQPAQVPGYTLGEILKSTVIWVVLGVAGGIFLGCAWVLIMLMMRTRAESSRQMEKMLQLPFLGSLAKRGDLFNRVACALLGERTWKNPQLAAAYITENLKALPAGEKTLVILSTLPEKKVGQALENARTAAAGAFETVYTVSDAERNPETVRVLSQCGRVLVAERTGVSDAGEVLAMMDTAKRLGATVEGFITL